MSTENVLVIGGGFFGKMDHREVVGIELHCQRI